MADELSALLQWLDAFQREVPSNPSKSVDDIADGTLLGGALTVAIPDECSDLDLRTGGGNWVMLRGNLNRIVEKCASFAVTFLGASSESDIIAGVDTTAVAKDKDPVAAATLLRLVLTVSLLGGDAETVARVKSLPKETQTVLQKAVKTVAAEKALKKRKPGERVTKANDVTPPTSSPVTEQPLKPRMSAFGANRLSEAEAAILQQEKNDLQDRLSLAESALRDLELRLASQKSDRDSLNERYQSLLESSSKSDALKAREFRDESAAKDAKIAQLTHDLHAVDDGKRELQSKIEQLRREHDTEMTKFKNELTKAKADHAQTQNELQLLKDLSEAQNRDRGNLEHHVQTTERERMELLAAIESLKSKNTQLESQISSSDEEIESMRREREELQSRLLMMEKMDRDAISAVPVTVDDASPPPKFDGSLHAEIEKKNAEIVHLREEIEKHRAGMDELRAENSRSKQHLMEATKRNSHAASTSGTMSDVQRLLQNELEQATKQVQDLKQTLADERCRFREHEAASMAAMFECGQRNLGLRVQLSAARSSNIDSVLHRDDEAASQKTWLQRVRDKLELWPLLDVGPKFE